MPALRARQTRPTSLSILAWHWSSRGGTRTPDPVINSHLLYQLSYSGLSERTKTSEAARYARRQAKISGAPLVRQRAASALG
jgi:hypothetical protein